MIQGQLRAPVTQCWSVHFLWKRGGGGVGALSGGIWLVAPVYEDRLFIRIFVGKPQPRSLYPKIK